MIISKINYTYQWQVTNFDFGGVYPGWAQCFTTSACMFLSSQIPGLNLDKKFIATYLDDVEVHIGQKGIGEQLVLKYDWIAKATLNGFSSQWWLIQRDAIEYYLQKFGVNKQVIFKDTNGTWQEVSDALKMGSPVIIGTMLPPSHGHIIMIVGETENTWICADPYGNAFNLYKGSNEVSGRDVEYDKRWITTYTEQMITGIPNAIRIMYAIPL